MMGRLHREKVYEVPAGFLTADERMVLLVLADQTPDFHQTPDGHPDISKRRLEYVHQRGQLMPKLGLDPSSAADHKWLGRRLGALEDAGFIARRKQRRRADGTWTLPSIKLELSATEFGALEIELGIVKPTVRAGHGDPRAKNLDGKRNNTRDDKGRFTSRPVDTPEGAVLDTPEGAVLDTPDGDRWTLPRVLKRTQPEREPERRTGQPTTSVVEVADFEDPDLTLDDRKRDAIAALASHWSMEDAI